MLFESEQHAAALAVSRYGADRAQVQQAIQSVLEARAQGHAVDLFDYFLEHNLLAPEQVQELRSGLDTTQFDQHRQPEVRPPLTNGPPGPAESLEGRTLGEYHIVRPLGEGGMGAVYLATRESPPDKEEKDRQVAIKVLPAHLAGNQAILDRFYREAKSGALLNHPNIVRNITVGQDRATGKHYLVLEYVDGPSAQGLLDQMGRLPVGDAVHIIHDIARALEHAHSRNVVHRDIKPANILITQSGVAKLADLGLAKRTDEASHLTAARQGFGTPYYMPYEQAMNARSADARSDLYALGATLYHLLTGEVPFPGSSHLEIVDKKNLGFYEPAGNLNPQVPAILDQILAKMLAREPRERYQTASELLVDLDRTNLAVPVPSFVDPERAWQDPVVRARLLAPAQSTCPDLNVAKAEPPPPRERQEPAPPEMWYLRYRDRQGQWCKAKATLAQIQERLREGKLTRQVEASLQPQGDFQPLASFPQFREALADRDKRRHDRKKRRAGSPPLATASAPRGLGDSALTAPSQRTWLIVGLTLSLAALLALVVLLMILRPS